MHFGLECQNVNKTIHPALDRVIIPLLFLCQLGKRLFTLRGLSVEKSIQYSRDKQRIQKLVATE